MGGKLIFETIENLNFYANLSLIDSSLPQIISEILLIYNSSKLSSILDLTTLLTSENPLAFDLSMGHPFYSYKIKKFLTDIALGMVSNSVWDGNYDANGGYIIVKEDGEVVCYHIYNKKEFEEYLFKNTRLETPSSSRNKFGIIYKENNGIYIKLNLQIRFIR
jgi:type II restriction enzyme